MSHESPTKVTVPITLDDRPFELAVDLNFYITFQKLTGVNLMQKSEALEGWEPTAHEIRAMLYAALRAGGAEVSEEEVGSLIHPGNMEYVGSKLQEVQQVNQPTTKGDEGTGNPSGAPIESSTG